MKHSSALAVLLTFAVAAFLGATAQVTMYRAIGSGTIGGTHPGQFQLNATRSSAAASKLAATFTFKEVVKGATVYQVVLSAAPRMLTIAKPSVSISGTGQCGASRTTVVNNTPIEVTATPKHLTVKCTAVNYVADGDLVSGQINITP